MTQNSENKKTIIYMHAGSGNHGCEALVNSFVKLINPSNTKDDAVGNAKPVLLTYRAEEDLRYSLTDLCEIRQEKNLNQHKFMHLLNYGYRKLTHDEESSIRYRYGEVLKDADENTVAISIGGDNYCYPNMLKDLRLANAAFKKKGAKTVLLGCSIEPDLLTKDHRDILDDLTNYDVIMARESITYEALLQAFPQNEHRCEGEEAKQLPKIYLIPDTAFTLEPKFEELPKGFAKGNTIGINISPMIQANEQIPGITGECYEELIQYIIDTTDMQIALIPHVIWGNNDDRVPCHELFEKYKDTGRVVEIGDCDCQTLKGYIASCRFFVGARTHSTIAAYSGKVPTLVVGYSVKAKGIAKDLFEEYVTEGMNSDMEKELSHFVIPVQSLTKRDDLIQGVNWMIGHEQTIRQYYEEKLPGYTKKILKLSELLDKSFE